MMLTTKALSPGLKAVVTGAFFAVLTGLSGNMVQAQDADLTDPPESTDDYAGEDPVLIDDTWLDEEVFVDPIDPVVLEDGTDFFPQVEPDDGEVIDTDGIGDGEPLPVEMDGEVVLDDDMAEVTDQPVDLEANPESTCGGCEYFTASGGPEVQRVVTADSEDNSGAAFDSVRNDVNICFDADLYVPLLCDWQRPFLGDRMP